MLNCCTVGRAALVVVRVLVAAGVQGRRRPGDRAHYEARARGVTTQDVPPAHDVAGRTIEEA